MMKYTTTHLTLSLLLLISISISISGVTGEDSPVKDTDGNEVKAGVEYTLIAEVLTSSFGLGGGLSLDSNCPPAVIQDTSNSVGVPVVFQSRSGSEVIHTSSELIIALASPTTCNKDDSSPRWVLDYDESLGRDAVKVVSGLSDWRSFMLKELLPSQYFLSYAGADIRFPRDDFFSSKRHLVLASLSEFGDVPFLVSITRAKTNNNLIIRNPTS